MLGIAQRAALLEDSLAGSPIPNAARAGIAPGRGRTAARAGPAAAADRRRPRRRSAAVPLAAQLLDGIADPAYLACARCWRRARGARRARRRSKVAAAGKLEAFARRCRRCRCATTPMRSRGSRGGSACSRASSTSAAAIRARGRSADRNAGYAALQLELTLPSCIERRDADGYRAALARADTWLQRLWPPSSAQRGLRERLRALRALPLAVDLPTLGSTLEQLRSLRTARYPSKSSIVRPFQSVGRACSAALRTSWEQPRSSAYTTRLTYAVLKFIAIQRIDAIPTPATLRCGVHETA